LPIYLILSSELAGILDIVFKSSLMTL